MLGYLVGRGEQDWTGQQGQTMPGSEVDNVAVAWGKPLQVPQWGVCVCVCLEAGSQTINLEATVENQAPLAEEGVDVQRNN